MMHMRALILSAGLLTGGLTGGQAAAAGKPLDEATMDRVVAIARAADFGGEIVLTDAAGMTIDRALGFADREAGVPHRAGQRWIWASVTKQVAALMVMQQVERGVLALDAPVTRYLPEFKGAYGPKITIAHLIQHRSGLPNPNTVDIAPDGIPAFFRGTGKAIAHRTQANGFCAGSAQPPSDDRFDYNNCDYILLGAILEAATGKRFDRLLSERIARPLGLRSVRMARDGAPRGGAAAVGYDGTARYPDVNVAALGAGGAITGTVRDLATLDRALMTGRLLSPASRAKLWEGDPKLGYQAYGVWSFEAPLAGCAGPVALIERRGDLGGTQVRNIIAPALGRAVMLFTNDGKLDYGEIWQGKGLSHDILAAALCS